MVTVIAVAEVSEEWLTIDEVDGTEVADVAAVSPDGKETLNASDALSNTDWMAIRWDLQGRPFIIHVRPLRYCRRWLFTRLSFDIKGATRFRVRIGQSYMTKWVSIIIQESIDTFPEKTGRISPYLSDQCWSENIIL